MDDPCVTCDGKGGKIHHDIEGDGEWAMHVVRVDAQLADIRSEAEYTMRVLSEAKAED